MESHSALVLPIQPVSPEKEVPADSTSPVGSPECLDDYDDDDREDAPSPPLVVSSDLPISSSEDVRSVGDLVRRMAVHLGFSTSQTPRVVDDVVFDVVIQAQLSTPVTIPITKVMLETAQSLLSKFSSLPSPVRGLTTCIALRKSQQFSFFITPIQTL